MCAEESVMSQAIMWGSVVASVGASVVKAMNIGYQREAYIVSAASGLPFILESLSASSYHNVIKNTFFFTISVFGAVRYKTKPDKT